MTIKFGFPVGSRVTINGQTVQAWGTEAEQPEVPETPSDFTAFGGRLNVIDGALTNPSVGTAVARGDGTTSLALWDVKEDTTISATLNGTPVRIAVSKPLQPRAFSSGKHYWLPQDATGRFKPEPGRNHRKIYLSGSASAMNKAAIAAHAGVTTATVTGPWLMARPQYGGSEEMPVTIDVYLLLLSQLQGYGKPGCSAWVRLERGYEYALTTIKGIKGESELHPFVIEAWGTGARPVLTSGTSWAITSGPRFMMFRDLNMTMFNPKYGYGVIFENCLVGGSDSGSQLRNMGMATMRECVVYDIAHKTPGSGRTTWAGSSDRLSGLYASGADDVILDGIMVDRCGWAEGYDFNRDGTKPMPPSDRNHGLYMTFTNHNVHIRDSFISRNSSCGIQNRMGGQYERILYADNNLAAGLHSGSKLGMINHFLNVVDNVNFGAGFKKVSGFQGTVNGGIDATAGHTAMIGCLVAHVANPDDPLELAERTWGKLAYNSNARFIYNDTQVYKWNQKSKVWLNERVEGIAPTTLDQTTLHRYAATLLNQPTASINDFVEYLRVDTEAQIGKTVRDAIRWTKARFGSPLPALRSAPASLIFQPDPRTEGFRWDNRLNWTTQDLPGAHIADSVDLAGNFVRFGTVDANIAALKSDGGTLDVSSGKLVTGAVTDALTVTVRNSGQIVLPETDEHITAKVSGGRIIFAGKVRRADVEARGNAEVLLGPHYYVSTGKSLVISGQRAMVGWDGTGFALLDINGTLEFRPGIAIKLSGSAWWEVQHYFRTDNAVTGPNFSATLSDYEEAQALYLSDLTGTPQVDETFVYGVKIDSNDYVNVDIPMSTTVGSIISRGFSPLQVFRSGSVGDGVTTPTVAATVLLRAGSTVKVDATGLAAGTYALTGPGVTVTNQGATLPAGVSVTNGALVLVVS